MTLSPNHLAQPVWQPAQADFTEAPGSALPGRPCPLSFLQSGGEEKEKEKKKRKRKKRKKEEVKEEGRRGRRKKCV